MKKQEGLAHLLLGRVVNVLKGEIALIAEGRSTGSDLEAETKFLLKRMTQL